jgi:hypothetical protein
MKTRYQFTLAALLLGAAGVTWSAEVPVIELTPSALEQVRHGAVAAPRRHGAGSFSSYASGAFSVLANAAAIMPQAPGRRYGTLVAARPLPPLAPVLLLGFGCLIYLGRRRQHGLALRPARTLMERFEHAPAHA